MTNNQIHLWEAASKGVYPTGTTAADLANCKDTGGWSILHATALHGKFPPGTTAADLANCKDNEGISALYYAALNGHLPPDTSPQLLQQTIRPNGLSAQDALILYCIDCPRRALRFAPELFQGQTTKAHQIANTAIRKNPKLHNKASIWLGHILASNQPNPTIA